MVMYECSYKWCLADNGNLKKHFILNYANIYDWSLDVHNIQKEI